MTRSTTLAAKAARKKSGASPASEWRGQRTPQPADLLTWYDRHRRALPWRAQPGRRADPYQVWLSEIMLQQTTVRAVAPYYAKFLRRWPDLPALAAASLDEVLAAWAGLGYYARARNMHACARVLVAEHGAKFPASEAGLRELPGIGAYTAAAIAAIAFDQAAMPIDGNVERVVARLYAVPKPLPAGKAEIALLARALAPAQHAGDFAQAMMDLGATICTPKKPACVLCPWSGVCEAQARGEAELFPRRTPKRDGELRRGAAFVARRADGCLLLRTRPANGLLGGMAEVPTTVWKADFDETAAIGAAPHFQPPHRSRAWRKINGVVRHVFTHFPLELTVYRTEVPLGAKAPQGMRWVGIADLADEALPSLMRKVVAHALA
jgi:A/G-specific adenine glycosylase